MSNTPHRRPWLVAVTSVLTVLAVVAGLLALGQFTSSSAPAAASTTGSTGDVESNFVSQVADALPEPITPEVQTPSEPPTFRNVVMVLADDLDWKLFDQIPRLAALKDKGMTFTNHTVVDSLCCPSRVTIMRGQYIHNHEVISNIEATGGGWPTFQRLGEDGLPARLARRCWGHYGAVRQVPERVPDPSGWHSLRTPGLG